MGHQMLVEFLRVLTLLVTDMTDHLLLQSVSILMFSLGLQVFEDLFTERALVEWLVI